MAHAKGHDNGLDLAIWHGACEGSREVSCGWLRVAIYTKNGQCQAVTRRYLPLQAALLTHQCCSGGHAVAS